MKISKIYGNVNNAYEIHDVIIKEIYKITGKITPLIIQTKDGKLIKIEIDAPDKKKEIEAYLDTL
jgi:hypothetical protein